MKKVKFIFLGVIILLAMLLGCNKKNGQDPGESASYFSVAKINDEGYSDYRKFLSSIGLERNVLLESGNALPEMSDSEVLRAQAYTLFWGKPRFYVCYKDRKAFALYPSAVYSLDRSSTFAILHVDIYENKIWLEEKLVPPGFRFTGKVKYSSFDKYFIAELRNVDSAEITEKKYKVTNVFNPDEDFITDLTPSSEVMKGVWRKHGSLTSMIYGTASLKETIRENLDNM